MSSHIFYIYFANHIRTLTDNFYIFVCTSDVKESRCIFAQLTIYDVEHMNKKQEKRKPFVLSERVFTLFYTKHPCPDSKSSCHTAWQTSMLCSDEILNIPQFVSNYLDFTYYYTFFLLKNFFLLKKII